MIPAELGTLLSAAVRDLLAAGDLPPTAAGLSPDGTWRPGPGPASYATSLPFGLARLAGRPPAEIAAALAPALSPAGWISGAAVTGDGYLTITVTPAALARVAVAVSDAGPACLASAALRGTTRPAPPLPRLAAASADETGEAGLTWQHTWHEQSAAVAGRIAQAAGANPAPGRPAAAEHDAGPALGTVAGAVRYLGPDPVRYWLTRLPASRASRLPAAAAVTPQEAPPGAGQSFSDQPELARDFETVAFAAASAAAALRRAAALGLTPDAPPEAGDLDHPAEIALLTALSWQAERVAAAARRSEPAALPRDLEHLAATWATCREECPALPDGGRAAPATPAQVSARLWLAAAVRAALTAGLALIGIPAPRMPGSQVL